jgi:hypothetical protein
MGWDSSHLSSDTTVWTIKNQILFSLFNLGAVAVAWCSGSPSDAPSSAGEVGAFGHRLFELRNKPRSVWLVRASFDGRPLWRATQEISGSWGAFLLVTYSLGKQRKVTRCKSEKNHYKQPQTRGHPCPPYTDQSKNNLLSQSHHTWIPTNA